MKKIFSICILALLISSCGIYKSYERPEVKTERLYRDTIQPGDEASQADTTSVGSLAWRELFTDPRLQTLIEEGLQQNTNLRIARLRVDQAGASLTAAKLSYLPALSLDPQGTMSSFDKQRATKSYQLPVSASWEIDLFGKLTNAKRKAKSALEQSAAYRQAVQSQLIGSIANTYYTLLMLDSQLAITRQTATYWQENIQTMRALKRAGQYNEAAVSQAEANSLSADASVLTLQQQIQEAENSLSTLLGRMPQSIVRGQLANQPFPQELSAGVPLQLLTNRPDVREAEYSLAQAFYATNEARSAFYPGITLSGSAGWTNNGGGLIANPGALLLQAVGSLTQPLFNKGKNRANLKIAKAQQEEATLTFQQTLLNAGAEVNNALTQFQTAQRRSALSQKQVTALQTTVRSTRLLMQHSTSTYLEVLTAQESLLQSQLTQVSDRFDEIQSVISLYQALGGGRE